MDGDSKYYIRSASGMTHGPFDNPWDVGTYYRNAAWLDGERPLIAVSIRDDGTLDDAWILELDTEYGVDGCKFLREQIDVWVDDYYEMQRERYMQGGGAR